jgi:Right handed beta helix region
MWALVLSCALAPQAVELRPGMVLDQSTKVVTGVYSLPRPDESGAALVIRGNDLTIDFAGATLLGSDWETAPDQRKGVGILVEGANITLKNMRVHGYKVGLIARKVNGLKILDSDFSYNWKQRLKSTLDAEDSSDWMSYHQNEKDEWLRFGAGIYLRDCDGFEVRGVRIVGGQCGLMVTECDRGLVWNSSFSFLSAIGLGMYRSSDNTVVHNNIDWCVRGYSHGKWNRGQDSAGILIYEQSNKNTFAYNSVTHGGDGFFLWAGQTTMDTGEGGCNDNLLYGNDFSHAPTNGIEATFSRNQFVNNLLMENWHGIWGGYSYDSLVLGNVFAYNAEAIAWEHGQNIKVQNNLFYRDTAGILLWQKPSEDPNWGYPKKRDTRSTGWLVQGNEWNSTASDAIRLNTTADFTAKNNDFSAVFNVLKKEGQTPKLSLTGNRTWVTANAKGLGEGNTNFVNKSYAPERAVMRPDGNVVTELDPNTEDYLERFSLNWAPYPSDPMPNRGLKDDIFLKNYYQQARKYAPRPKAGGKRP